MNASSVNEAATEAAAQAVKHVPFETITISTVFSGAGLLAILTLLIRQIGPWRKQTTEATDKLIDRLAKRVDKLEDQLQTERRMNFIETRRIEARHNAQMSLYRHKFTNADTNLDSLLRILELSPERAQDAARQAREARASQRHDEAVEAAEIHKAEVLAIAEAEKELARQDAANKAAQEDE